MRSHGERHHNAKLTRYRVQQIRHLLKQGRPQQRVAYLFDVSQSTISMIANRITWKHLGDI